MSDKQKILLQGALFCSLLFLLLFSGCGGSKHLKKTEIPEYSFYELCFYFPRVPEGTKRTDVEEASLIYAEHLENRGTTVFKRRSYNSSSCFFIDNVPDFSKPVKMTSNNISQYLLNAYFEKETSSLFGIDLVHNRFDMIHAELSQKSFLPIFFPIEEGLFLRGESATIVFLARYLEVLDIKHQFGVDDSGRLIINLENDDENRWMMVPFLYDSIDLGRIVSPKPGDYSILSECKEKNTTVSIVVPPWEKTEVPFIKEQSVGKEDSLFFSNGILSLPFGEDVLLRYIYSLAESHLLPPSSGLFYSPNFSGGVVIPKVFLLSSELSIDGVTAFSAEKIFLWILSVNSELNDYPQTIYSNILSLKIAKKLYTGSTAFLGGSELFNPTAAVPFTAVRKYLFNKGNVSVFGSVENGLYLNTDEIIQEYPSFSDINKVKGFKAFFGSPDMSSESLVSIVFRSEKAFELKNSVLKILYEKGYPVIQTLFEQISGNDSWGAVSIKVSKESEKDFLELFEKSIKNKHISMSLGVYRVPE